MNKYMIGMCTKSSQVLCLFKSEVKNTMEKIRVYEENYDDQLKFPRIINGVWKTINKKFNIIFQIKNKEINGYQKFTFRDDSNSSYLLCIFKRCDEEECLLVRIICKRATDNKIVQKIKQIKKLKKSKLSN